MMIEEILYIIINKYQKKEEKNLLYIIYMSREHSKEVLQEINLLRGLFEKYGKNKTSTLLLNEIQDFLSKLNVIKNLFN